MVWELVKCPWCGSVDVVRNGVSSNGKQKYRCNNNNCPHKSFQRDYKNKACVPGMRNKIVDMTMNGSGTRDIARVLGINKDTVTATLRGLGEFVNPVNEQYLADLGPDIEVDIVVCNSTETEDEDSQSGADDTRKQPPIEAEADEMWSYYHDKSHQDWLWWAVDHKTNTPLAFTFGTREHCNLDILLGYLSRFNIVKFYTDNNFAYSNHIPDENHEIGKRNTQNIERDHLTLRTRIKRLARKTICFSKVKEIHEAVIGAFINLHFFGMRLSGKRFLDDASKTAFAVA